MHALSPDLLEFALFIIQGAFIIAAVVFALYVFVATRIRRRLHRRRRPDFTVHPPGPLSRPLS